MPVTYVPVKIPGLSLFTEPLSNGATGMIKLLPIPVTVDATQKGTISVGISGITMPVPGSENISDAASSIAFNGIELIGKKTDLNLGSSPIHNIVITCR